MLSLDWTVTPDDARALYAIVATFIVPFVVSFIKRATWSPGRKVALALVVSLIGALLAEYAAGTLSGSVRVLILAGAVFAAAQAHYATWFQSTGAEQWLAEDRLIRDRLRLL